MKTWFCKDTQKWVSEIPRAFWIGVYDYKTGEKLYSDDVIYSADPFLRSLYKKPFVRIDILRGFKRRGDCRGLKFGSHQIPILSNHFTMYTKYTY